MFMTRIAVCVHICRSRSINCTIVLQMFRLDVFHILMYIGPKLLIFSDACAIQSGVLYLIRSRTQLTLGYLCSQLIYGYCAYYCMDSTDCLFACSKLSMIVPRYSIGVDSSMFIYCHGFIVYSNKLKEQALFS